MELSNLAWIFTAGAAGLVITAATISYMVYKMKNRKKSSVHVFPGIKVQKNYYAAAEYRSQDRVYTYNISDNFAAVSDSGALSVRPAAAKLVDIRYR